MRSFFKKIISPFGQLVFFVVLIPILELFLLLHFFGVWFTLLSMLLCGLFGVFLAYRQGWRCWNDINQRLDSGESSALPALHLALIMMGAFFLILPGMLTGLFGVVLLFPITRAFVVSYLVLHFEAYRHQARRGHVPRSPEVIDI